MAGLSFVTPLAYDWKYAFSAVRSYYAIADEIVLGVDADRISWSKMPFLFDDKAVVDFVAEIDTDKKIRIVQGNFHAHDRPMDNDTFERRHLGSICREGNWVVQIDSDEILLNPREFRAFMNDVEQDSCVYAGWLPVYKIIGDKALVVCGLPETTPVATRSPQCYCCARLTDQPRLMSRLNLLHLSWCREEGELLQKLMNWSHSKEIDIGKTVGLWRSTTLENCHQLRNFHPLHGPLWPYLEVIDWPPKTVLDESIPGQPTAAGTQNKRVVLQGKTADGGLLISFGGPATITKIAAP